MKLIDFETTLLLYGLHHLKVCWCDSHWLVSFRDSADMKFESRADHIESAFRQALHAFHDSYKPIPYKLAGGQ